MSLRVIPPGGVVSLRVIAVLVGLTGCELPRDDVPATGVPCAVEGGACPPGNLCLHVCDCCGIPPDEDAGIVPSGHDTCVPEDDQCGGGTFFFEGHTCNCMGNSEAACPCA